MLRCHYSACFCLKQECIKVLISPPPTHTHTTCIRALLEKKHRLVVAAESREVLLSCWVTVSEPSRQTNACPILRYSLWPPVACITGFAFCMVSMPTYYKKKKKKAKRRHCQCSCCVPSVSRLIFVWVLAPPGSSTPLYFAVTIHCCGD